MLNLLAQLATDSLRLGKASAAIHLTAGCLALVFGLIATFTRKGAGRHRLAGKIGVGLLLVVVSTAFVLLILLDVLPMPGNISYKQDAVDLLALLFLTGTYTTLQGYRWAVNHKPKLDSDVVLMGMAAFISIFSFYNAIADLVLFPYTSTDKALPMNPMTATMITFAIGGLFAYFSYDDIKTYLKGKVTPQERVLKHTYRIMAAVGGVFMAVAITNLGPIFVTNNWNPLPVYLVPPTLFGGMTMYLANRVSKPKTA